MKHLLNDLSESERNRILEQYNNSLIVETKKFDKLTNAKLGNLKPLLSEQENVDEKKKEINQKLNKELIYLKGNFEKYLTPNVKALYDGDKNPKLKENIQINISSIKMNLSSIKKLVDEFNQLKKYSAEITSEPTMNEMKAPFDFDPSIYDTYEDDETSIITKQDLLNEFSSIKRTVNEFFVKPSFDTITRMLMVLPEKLQYFSETIKNFKQ